MVRAEAQVSIEIMARCALDHRRIVLPKQPGDLERDRNGCFKGCRWSGCALTDCRRYMHLFGPPRTLFYWSRVEVP